MVGSVNGLTCLAMEDYDLVMWNPSIRKYKKLPDSRPRLKKLTYDFHSYGFGYDEFHDDYKVVGIFTCGSLDQVEFKIFSLKSDSWTSVIGCLSGVLLNVLGKFVNGKLHWATMAPGANRCMFGNIISFDLADEKWENVELPCYGGDEIALFWLGLLGSDLSIICDRRGTHVDVWVMKRSIGLQNLGQRCLSSSILMIKWIIPVFHPFSCQMKVKFWLYLDQLS
uniref:F-box/kelch-repeat protein At3g23880-like n=1 Tax=Nicotiana sylvestris TaxID=4096 RepID=A0A1U7VNL9_NICSY|nr:PREDICTED: F-box/kelch-repeat protein At3g23880-like [Nicotiana sylvestris]